MVTAGHILVNNAAPSALPQSLQGTEDTPLAIQLSATDPEGYVAGYLVTAPPFHGTLSGTAPNLIYTPNPNFFGTDRFLYRASDGTQSSPEAIVTVAIAPVNDPPVAAADSASVLEGQSVSIDVLANDTDPEGDPLTAALAAAPSHGTATAAVGGSFSYTPAPGYHGVDTFTYTASDGHGGTATGTVTVTVYLPNRPPAAQDDTGSTTTGTPVTLPILANDTDPDGDVLSLVSVTPPAHGTANPSSRGIVYIPSPGFVGVDCFTYIVTDPLGALASAEVTVTVRPANQAPTALAQSVRTAEDAPVAVTLSGVDPEGEALSFTLLAGPSHGTLTGTAPILVYTPSADYAGEDSFTFSVSDGALDSEAATVSLVVTPVNDAPSVTELTVPATAGVPTAITLKAADADGDPLTYEVVTAPKHGMLGSVTGAEVTYTADVGYTGTDSFTYRAADGSLWSPEATVTVVVAKAGTEGVLVVEDVTAEPGGIVLVPVTASGLDGLSDLRFTVAPGGPVGSPLLAWLSADRGSGLSAGALESECSQEGVVSVRVSGASLAAEGPLVVLRFSVPKGTPNGATFPLVLSDTQATLRTDPPRTVFTGQTGGTVTVHVIRPRGDATGDGTVNIGDVLMALRLALSLEPGDPAQLGAADLNGDGTVTIGDVVLLIRLVLGLDLG
ncbi:MAG TPA: Ig-like domain-containing protein [Armatimonadota bacterium]|jgi:hypothetical protein